MTRSVRTCALMLATLTGVGRSSHTAAPEFVTPRILEWLESSR